MTETSTHPPTFTRTPIAPAVEVTGVSKRYGALLAVDDVSISVQRGEVHGLLGPNGAGKTTLLRMLFGLIRPDAGSLQIFGRSVTESAVRALDGVGGFIESPRFYPYLTGRQHLSGLGLLDGGVGADSVADVLEVVDLTARADDRVGGYSYGMRQRLGVAASLLRSPAPPRARRAGQRPGSRRHPRHAGPGDAAGEHAVSRCSCPPTTWTRSRRSATTSPS